MSSQKDGASTFAKGLKVIESFEGGRADMTMADIARVTGFDRATTRRLCLTLEDSGYLVRDNRALRLSPKVVAIAGGYLASHAIGRSVQPILNQFAEELEGEIALAVRDGDRAIYIARSAVSSARLSLGLSVGSALPVLATSVGHMLLAGCRPEIRETLIASAPPRKWTEATDVDPSSLREKIAQAAARGFAHVVSEFELGAAGVAVPAPAVGDREAVLGTTDTVKRFEDPTELERTIDTLRRAAISMRR